MAPIIQVYQSAPRFADQRRFGRRYAPDPRDMDHTMEMAIRAMAAEDQKRRKQSPQRGPTLNQGNTPKCVKYSAATALAAAPIMYGHTPESVIQAVEVRVVEAGPQVNVPLVYDDLYSWGQAHDEWPGEDYEGTSVRAGQEYLLRIRKSARYVWATSFDEAKDYITRVGSAPMILGIDWMQQMDKPLKIGGAYYITPGGPVLGGHAICTLWRDGRKKAWRMQQTWGPDFGDDGIVYLPDDGFNYLVFQANGEAVSFVEQRAT